MRFLLFALIAVAVAQKCGKGTLGCKTGNCCSYWGYCGTTTDYCGTGTYQCVCDCTAKGACISNCQIRYAHTTTNIRKTASTTGTVVKTIYRGDTVCFTDKTTTGWAKLDDGNYVYAMDLAVDNPVKTTTTTCTNYVTTASVNNRSEPNTSSKIIKTFASGTTVCVASFVNDSWAKLSDGSYVSKSYISKPITRTNVAGIKFNYAAPSNLGSLTSYKLWATGYYTPAVYDGGSFALRTPSNEILGSVTQKEWCNCAMQGSCTIVKGSTQTTITVSTSTDAYTVSCSAYYPTMSGYQNCRLKFAKSTGLYGNGAYLYVVPYRSVAVDKSKIPYGTALYIPSAVGNKVTLPDGRTLAHDGYFIAADTGGAIKTNHIDVYFGNTNPLSSNPFSSWVRSTESATFTAYKVADAKITEELYLFSKGFYQ